MPMYGFSEIGPAQKIKLHLLYSPRVKEAGSAGGQAVHMFNLICTTMERLAANKPGSGNFNPEEQVSVLYLIVAILIYFLLARI